ncbi:MAG: hypothetical protein COB46_06130 [Rhodospirillaceae bacterium]|nr:MAG: hypothetical protein COB46_06130 [Rhodospirillaceae bacterium]
MDNTIAGLFGILIFLAFVGGLAISIGSVPFMVIVAIIGVMAVYDFYESVRDERKAATDKASRLSES